MTRDGASREMSGFGTAADKILRSKDVQLKELPSPKPAKSSLCPI